MDISKSSTILRRKMFNSTLEPPHEKDNFSIKDFEEMGEVSLQLGMIRKKFDILKQENVHKRETLQKLKSEYEQISVLTNVHAGDQSTVENSYNQIQSNLNSQRRALEEEFANKRTYKHIYDRLLEEKICLEKDSNRLHSQLKSVTQVLRSEKSKFRKNFEAISTSRNSLKHLKIMVDYDNKQQMERISCLEKNASSRKEAADRREERIKKIAEIADIAANENTELDEIKIKQSVILHKTWHAYLKYKLEKKLQGAIEIEDAYQNIKSATGLQSISEIVSNFIGKEENQAQLLKNIKEANENLDALKEKNEKSKGVLKELMLIEGDATGIDFFRRIREIDEEITRERKNSETAKEEFNRLQEFFEEIATWGKKAQKSLDLGTESDILKVFEDLKGFVSYELGSLAANKEQFLKDWNQTNETSTDALVKSIYQDTYNMISVKFKSTGQDLDSSHGSFHEVEKRKKPQKKSK